MTGMFRADHTGLTLHLPLPEALPTLLWAAGAALALFFTLMAMQRINRKRSATAWRGVTAVVQRHYLTILIPFGIPAVVLVIWLYFWQIPGLIGQMLQALKLALKAELPKTEDIRNIGYTVTALAGMLAILATIPLQLIRIWINERTARTQEANLTTGLINTAVEGLGAEKKVSRIGRPVRFTTKGAPDRTEIEWKDRTPPAPREGETVADPGEWKTFESTQPNLEVRIGAILTLDRIARENPGEHIRVMDILCAYIRENAPASEAPGHDLGEWLAYPENPTPEEREHRSEMLRERREGLDAWIERLPPARTDIQVALEVIGRRDSERIAREEDQLKQQKFQTAISVGATVLGAFFGKKKVSSTNVGRATTAMRSASRVSREQGDLGRAEDNLESLQAELADFEREFQSEVDEMKNEFEVQNLELERVEIPPKKSEISVEELAVVWTPWARTGRDLETLYVVEVLAD